MSVYRRHRRFSLTCLCACVAAAGLAACGSDDDATTSDAAAATKKASIGWFSVGPNSYMDGQFEAARAEARKRGASLTVIDPGFNATKQINQIQDAVTAKKFDAIIVTPLNGVGVASAVRQAKSAGIPVIANEAPIGPRTDTNEPQADGVVASVMVTQDQQGDAIADLAVKACEGKATCRVAVENLNGSFAGDRAIDKALAEREKTVPGFKVVTTVPTNNLRDKALAATRDILQAHPDIDVIATSGDQVAAGAEIGVRNAGKQDQVRILGHGASKPGVEKVRGKAWFGTTILVPGEQGRLSMDAAIKAAQDALSGPAGIDPVSAMGLPRSLDQSNLDELKDFEPQWAG